MDKTKCRFRRRGCDFFGGMSLCAICVGKGQLSMPEDRLAIIIAQLCGGNFHGFGWPAARRTTDEFLIFHAMDFDLAGRRGDLASSPAATVRLLIDAPGDGGRAGTPLSEKRGRRKTRGGIGGCGIGWRSESGKNGSLVGLAARSKTDSGMGIPPGRRWCAASALVAALGRGVVSGLAPRADRQQPEAQHGQRRRGRQNGKEPG